MALVSRWMLNGNATDLMGAHNGTDSGTVVYSGITPVKYGRYITFDGGADYINTGNWAITSNSAISISAWIKTTSTARFNILCQNKTGATDSAYLLYQNAGNITLLVTANPFSLTLNTSSSGYALNDGRWHHIVITDNNGTVASYIDGATANLTASYSRPPQAPDAVYIGAAVNAAPTYATGNLSDVQYYNSILTSDEVGILYNDRAAAWVYPPSRWKLDGDATDSSGVYNLTATGVTFPSYDKMSGNYYAQFSNTGVVKIEGTSPNILSYPNFTITAWHRVWGGGTGGDIINFGDGTAALWQLFTYTYSSAYYLYPGKLFSISTTEKTFLGDYYYKWAHVSVVDRNGTISVYINGELRSTLSSSRNAGTVNVLSIGANTVGTNKYYGYSMVDDVRLYDFALSATEVKQLYNSYFTEKSSQFLSHMF